MTNFPIFPSQLRGNLALHAEQAAFRGAHQVAQVAELLAEAARWIIGENNGNPKKQTSVNKRHGDWCCWADFCLTLRNHINGFCLSTCCLVWLFLWVFWCYMMANSGLDSLNEFNIFLKPFKISWNRESTCRVDWFDMQNNGIDKRGFKARMVYGI